MGRCLRIVGALLVIAAAPHRGLSPLLAPDSLRAVPARTYDCPQCGAPVKFESSITVFAVCSFCQSMVVRKDASVERLGSMAELPPDMSPLQIGTRGEWRGEAFELIGRVRLGWEQGTWTEWCAAFSGDQIGWVAEAQGFYMVTMQAAVPDVLPRSPSECTVGKSVRFADHTWRFVDVKEVACIAVEGELPYVSPPGSRRTNADIAGGKGDFGTVEFLKDGPELYLGSYAEFEHLKFSNTRPVPGWTAEIEQVRHKTRALNCPNCGAVVELRAAGQTQAAVCGSCGTLIDTANPELQIIQTSSAAITEAMRKTKAIIPIGRRGRLYDTEWETIGLQSRKDEWVTWTEYLLFNPWKGFRWLVFFRGHWSFVRPMFDQPENPGGNAIRHKGEKFSLYARGEAKVQVVLGEFYWKVERGERAIVSDYICPPRILSQERYPDLEEETWSLGEYVEPSEIRAAFALESMPWRHGIYLNQPNPWKRRWREVVGWASLFLVLYLAIQTLFAMSNRREPVWAGTFKFERQAATKVAVTPQFKLKGGQQPLRIDVGADVDNNWMGFDVQLVNAATNQTVASEVGVERYSGYEEGEYWNEGSSVGNVTFPAVPAGDYFVTFDAEADPNIAQMDYRVRITPGGLFWSNFWLGLFLLWAYPAFVLWRAHSWEAERWSESDYTP